MWKKFMTGLLMALAVLTLTACGNSTGTASQAPADGFPGAGRRRQSSCQPGQGPGRLFLGFWKYETRR